MRKPPGGKFDPETDRVLVLSKAGPGDTPVWLNGSESPNLEDLRKGQAYRLRIINMLPDNPPVEIRLEPAGVPVNWRPLAKDGADLPTGQRALGSARQTLSIGETYDFVRSLRRTSPSSCDRRRQSAQTLWWQSRSLDSPIQIQ